MEILPKELQEAFLAMPQNRRDQAAEVRLRLGQPAQVVFPWGQELLTRAGRPIPVTGTTLKAVLDRATAFSPYALKLEETGLFLPLDKGCRLGLCGEAVTREGKLLGLRHVSSMVLRLARQKIGIAEQAAEALTAQGRVQSVLVVSPPGGGKTTFLRDLIRAVSARGFRVSVADERRELAGASQGVPQLDLGPNTDVLSGCPKAQAMGLLVRVMNPQVLAVDELAGPAELQAAQEAAHCGVALFATAHGRNFQDLLERNGYRELAASGALDWCITLDQGRMVRMERLGNYGETHGRLPGGGGVIDAGLGGPAGSANAGGPAAAAAAGPGTDAERNGTGYAAGGRAV
jgi:stage III sporulation protein AA